MSKVILKEPRDHLGDFIGLYLFLPRNAPSFTESVGGVAHHLVGGELPGVGDFRNEGHWREATSHFANLSNIVAWEKRAQPLAELQGFLPLEPS